MGHSNGNITAPVNTDDVSAVTGVSSHDVGTLCLSDRVNKWNKNKPYRGTSPTVADRTVDNYNSGDNGTGKYLGNRGTATGFPCYWGMRYPMNTAQQNGSGVGRSNLLQLCYDIINDKGNHPNYEYMKPVAGTDFFRLEDFIGYQQNGGAFLDAGVQGAKAGNGTYATLRINKFENSGISIYAIIPSDSVGWEFKDIIIEPNTYKLVAEFYKNDTANVWKSGSTANPFLTVQSTKYMDNWNGMSIDMGVSIADILTALGDTSTTMPSFFVCVGFNKYTAATPTASSAFVAPWVSTKQKCVTLVTVVQASPYVVSFDKYAFGSSNTYSNFPTSAINATSDTLKFQTSVKNNGSTAMKIFGLGNAQSSGLLFRMRAVGSYGAFRGSNTNHTSAGGDDSNGAWRILEVATNSDMSSNVNNVTINAGATMTIYFRANNLLPYGYTTGIIIEVSNDGGSTWATTGMTTAYFNRLNA